MAKEEETVFIIKDEFRENPELFIPLIAVIVLMPLAWFHVIEFPAAMVEVLLSLLFLYNIAIIRQRKQLKNMQSFLESTSDNILFDKYPADYLENLGRAEKEIWITGTNLRRIFPEHTELLKKGIERGATLIAILPREGNVMKYAAQQDMGPLGVANDFLGTLTPAIIALRALKKMAPDRVHIKTIDYPLPFGIDAIDIDSKQGAIYVRFYPFFGDGDRPILVLRPYQSKWFDFYKSQLKIQNKEYAKDIDHRENK